MKFSQALVDARKAADAAYDEVSALRAANIANKSAEERAEISIAADLAQERWSAAYQKYLGLLRAEAAGTSL